MLTDAEITDLKQAAKWCNVRGLLRREGLWHIVWGLIVGAFCLFILSYPFLIAMASAAFAFGLAEFIWPRPWVFALRGVLCVAVDVGLIAMVVFHNVADLRWSSGIVLAGLAVIFAWVAWTEFGRYRNYSVGWGRPPQAAIDKLTGLVRDLKRDEPAMYPDVVSFRRLADPWKGRLLDRAAVFVHGNGVVCVTVKSEVSLEVPPASAGKATLHLGHLVLKGKVHPVFRRRLEAWLARDEGPKGPPTTDVAPC